MVFIPFQSDGSFQSFSLAGITTGSKLQTDHCAPDVTWEATDVSGNQCRLYFEKPQRLKDNLLGF